MGLLIEYGNGSPLTNSMAIQVTILWPICSASKRTILMETEQMGFILTLLIHKKLYNFSLFEETENRNALSNMVGDNAPGPEDFSIAFFQTCWGEIKENLMVVFNEFHKMVCSKRVLTQIL